LNRTVINQSFLATVATGTPPTQAWTYTVPADCIFELYSLWGMYHNYYGAPVGTPGILSFSVNGSLHAILYNPQTNGARIDYTWSGSQTFPAGTIFVCSYQNATGVSIILASSLGGVLRS